MQHFEIIGMIGMNEQNQRNAVFRRDRNNLLKIAKTGDARSIAKIWSWALPIGTFVSGIALRKQRMITASPDEEAVFVQGIEPQWRHRRGRSGMLVRQRSKAVEESV